MNLPRRRLLHKKLREKSESDGDFQDGEYEEEEPIIEPEPEGE